MFIRKTATRNESDNESYFTHRLVASVRPGSKVHQSTLLNLGRHFDLPRSNWPRLCTRIEALRASQGGILPEPETIETLGQRYGALPIAAGPEPPHGPTPSTVPPSTAPDAPSNLIFAEVDIASLQLTWPRSVGVEDAGRAAMDWLGVDRILADLGLNGVQRDAVTGLLIGRMHAPAKAGAAEANIVWLKEQGYHYLVVSRERGRKFDPERATDTLTASNETFSPQRVPSEDGTEVRLYCHSPGREAKDTAISARFVTSFEAGLEKLAAGLDKPRGQKSWRISSSVWDG
jgi:hypothetical protein